MSKRDPVVKIQIHVPADVPARASVAALAASNEVGRVVPAYEMHRRAYLAGLRLLEVCAGCRAGTCDGSKHVRLPEHKNLEVGLTSNGFLGAGDSGPRRMRRAETFSTPSVLKNEPNEKPVEMHEDLPTSAVPKSVEPTPTEQVGMFFTEPTEDKPAPEPKKKPRKRSYPEGFALTDEMRAYAVKNGIAPDRVDGMFEHFSNHHRAKGSMFVDWTLAFYTWVRNDKQYGGKNQARSAQPAAIQGGKDDMTW